jgi:Baseplate J-like protein
MPAFKNDLSSGLVLVDSDEIAQNLSNSFSQVLGENINTTRETIVGQIREILLASRMEISNSYAAIINATFNPYSAQGPMLDNLIALLGVKRRPASKSKVDLLFTAIDGTLIPDGTQVQNNNGLTFVTLSPLFIDSSGNGAVKAEAVEFGPFDALAGTLTNVIDDIDGFLTVTNPNDATIGADEQVDDDLRRDYKDRQGVFGFGTIFALKSAVANLEGVRSFSFLENFEATQQIIKGVTMPPKSFYFCVQGGQESDIAQAIVDKKSLGSQWCHGNGTQITATVLDSSNTFAYNVFFDRPNPVTFELFIKIKPIGNVGNVVQYIKELILSNFQNNTRSYANDLTWGVGKPIVPNFVGADLTAKNSNIAIKSSLTRTRTSLGSWNAATNTPLLTDVIANNANIVNRFYTVSNVGSTALSGITSWSVNDLAFWDGEKFIKVPNNSGAINFSAIPKTCEETSILPWEIAQTTNSYIYVSVEQ